MAAVLAAQQVAAREQVEISAAHTGVLVVGGRHREVEVGGELLPGSLCLVGGVEHGLAARGGKHIESAAQCVGFHALCVLKGAVGAFCGPGKLVALLLVYVQANGIVGMYGGVARIGIDGDGARHAEVDRVGAAVVGQGVAVYILDGDGTAVLGGDGHQHMGYVGAGGQRVGIVYHTVHLVDVAFVTAPRHRGGVGAVGTARGGGVYGAVQRAQHKGGDGGVAVIGYLFLLVVQAGTEQQGECGKQYNAYL